MAVLTGKIGSWELPHVHMWKDQTEEFIGSPVRLVHCDSRVAAIGSCFANEITKALQRKKVDADLHPAGLFYNTRSIRQEIERVFGQWPAYGSIRPWQTKRGWVHPLRSYADAFSSESELAKWNHDIDSRAESLFAKANLVVITLGLIEAWIDPADGTCFRAIPHPDAFESCGAELHRLTTAEMVDDLTRIRTLIREHSGAEMLVTVSPVPLHATMTDRDVRIANCESKSRIRAAVSEFCDGFPDVHYFHSYEIVQAARFPEAFMLPDGRHVRPEAAGYIVDHFLRRFADPNLAPQRVDSNWIDRRHSLARRASAGDRAWHRWHRWWRGETATATETLAVPPPN